eukprot:Rhum_TRINITY_DN14524_c20_g1::Rhum_TRINITY_DN14524_c20_g1_i1::g.96744::m.96744
MRWVKRFNRRRGDNKSACKKKKTKDLDLDARQKSLDVRHRLPRQRPQRPGRALVQRRLLDRLHKPRRRLLQDRLTLLPHRRRRRQRPPHHRGHHAPRLLRTLHDLLQLLAELPGGPRLVHRQVAVVLVHQAAAQARRLRRQPHHAGQRLDEGVSLQSVCSSPAAPLLLLLEPLPDARRQLVRHAPQRGRRGRARVRGVHGVGSPHDAGEAPLVHQRRDVEAHHGGAPHLEHVRHVDALLDGVDDAVRRVGQAQQTGHQTQPPQLADVVARRQHARRRRRRRRQLLVVADGVRHKPAEQPARHRPHVGVVHPRALLEEGLRQQEHVDAQRPRVPRQPVHDRRVHLRLQRHEELLRPLNLLLGVRPVADARVAQPPDVQVLADQLRHCRPLPLLAMVREPHAQLQRPQRPWHLVPQQRWQRVAAPPEVVREGGRRLRPRAVVGQRTGHVAAQRRRDADGRLRVARARQRLDRRAHALLRLLQVPQVHETPAVLLGFVAAAAAASAAGRGCGGEALHEGRREPYRGHLARRRRRQQHARRLVARTRREGAADAGGPRRQRPHREGRRAPQVQQLRRAGEPGGGEQLGVCGAPRDAGERAECVRHRQHRTRAAGHAQVPYFDVARVRRSRQHVPEQRRQRRVPHHARVRRAPRRVAWRPHVHQRRAARGAAGGHQVVGRRRCQARAQHRPRRHAQVPRRRAGLRVPHAQLRRVRADHPRARPHLHGRHAAAVRVRARRRGVAAVVALLRNHKHPGG